MVRAEEMVWCADSSGVRMRVGTVGASAGGRPSLGGLVVEELRGECRSGIQAADIYPALERGTIDAAEFVGPYDDENAASTGSRLYYYSPAFWEERPSCTSACRPAGSGTSFRPTTRRC